MLERATNAAEMRHLIPRRHEATPTRSDAERRLVELLNRAGLRPFATNTRRAGFEVDVAFDEQRLVVELDGYAFHHTRAAFEHDRRKDAALMAEGWRVLRVTWRRLTEHPEAVVADLARAL